MTRSPHLADIDPVDLFMLFHPRFVLIARFSFLLPLLIPSLYVTIIAFMSRRACSAGVKRLPTFLYWSVGLLRCVDIDNASGRVESRSTEPEGPGAFASLCHYRIMITTSGRLLSARINYQNHLRCMFQVCLLFKMLYSGWLLPAIPIIQVT